MPLFFANKTGCNGKVQNIQGLVLTDDELSLRFYTRDASHICRSFMHLNIFQMTYMLQKKLIQLRLCK